jgi:glycosyltransferase involved in cell wall biosynthesis
MQLGIVVPCYNEQEVLPETAVRLLHLLEELIGSGVVSESSKIWFVDDGSRDNTWPIVERLATQSRHVSGIRLSRNRGHQNALMAGLVTAEGDALVSVDADLQDDIRVIEEMVKEWQRGADVVYGVRRSRDTDTSFKRKTAELFYGGLRVLGVETVYNHADFRLMSRRAVDALKEFREVNLYLRGIVPLIGFRSAVVYYDRAERFAGESKYPLKKMLGLALDAVTSFSAVPLRLISLLGLAVFLGTVIVSLWVLWVRLFTDRAVPGWASTVLPLYFIGGVQIFCIGIIGEYLGKIYSEVKGRPRYVIDKIV